MHKFILLSFQPVMAPAAQLEILQVSKRSFISKEPGTFSLGNQNVFPQESYRNMYEVYQLGFIFIVLHKKCISPNDS